MKKILIFALIAPLLAFTTIKVYALEKTNFIYVHYYRYDEKYSDWTVWMWQKKPLETEGASYTFVEDDTDTIFNYGGVVAKIELKGNVENATEVGIILRRGDWLEKDIEFDRQFIVDDETTDGIKHVYFVQGDERIGTSIDDPDGPDRNHKLTRAFFTSLSTIKITATTKIHEDDLTLTIDDITTPFSNFRESNNAIFIDIDSDLDFSKNYELTAKFSETVTSSLAVTFDGIYDTDEFNNNYAYEGTDLGATASDTETFFRIWAPISSSVDLNIYETGTPLSLGGSDAKTVHSMTSDVKGTFYHSVSGNLHGKYYTYTITNGNKTYEVVDPYAKSTGINGLRGLIVDFSKTNPAGFKYNDLADNITNITDAIIYELHVRDLTTHESWNGTEGNRGKFLGLIEEGTKYNGYTTGFDHIKELGVTHVQLLPFYDFGVVDETKLDDDSYNAFNWGYMPLHFNTLEGSYSSNPYDGLTRISEMKKVVTAYKEANIRINMDVVYNHTGLSADSNFNLIIPGYYHRMTDSNGFSNGSGTGNETASERYMMRKFIVDSVVFWATEYNIAGFRFDLMALHDLETMNAVSEALHAIDSTIMVYGEPWTGGTSTLPSSDQSGKENLTLLENVGAFNDDFRDAVKGSVFMKTEGGFIQGNLTEQNIQRVKYGIAGGTNFEGLNTSLLSYRKVWHGEPSKTINYVTAHDNNTLHDKLYQTLEESGNLNILDKLMKQANAIVLTSQGISFLHAGDEFARTKPAENGKGFNDNSYESPDNINQLRWDKKGEQLELFNYYKGLISLRKSNDLFRLSDSKSISEKLNFVYENKKGIIAYTLSDNSSNFLVIHNSNKKTTRIKLPKNGGWHVIVDGETAGTNSLYTHKGGETIKLAANSSYVLYQDSEVPDVDHSTLIIILSITGIIAVGAAVFLLIKTKKNEQ